MGSHRTVAFFFLGESLRFNSFQLFTYFYGEDQEWRWREKNVWRSEAEEAKSKS